MVIILFIGRMCSCEQQEKPIVMRFELVKTHHSQKVPPKRIQPIYEWISPNYYPFFTFNENKDTLFMTYDGQCGYYYPVRKEKNKLILLFTNDMDCTHDVGLDTSYGLKKHPKIGEPFMEMIPINDTVLRSKHLFPSWADSVNAQYEPIPRFVNTFRLIDLNYPSQK